MTSLRSVQVVLLDLDGVIRHFDPSVLARIESAHGMKPGVLREIAFAPDLANAVLTGEISRASWIREIGTAVGSHQAAGEWLSQRGTVDTEMLGMIRSIRQAGTCVAVLTNGTDSLTDELSDLELDQEFDVVFNSAAIGYAKPDQRAFLHVSDALGVRPEQVYYTDDSVSKLAGAYEIGMDAHHFVDVAHCRHQLLERGVIAASL